MIQQVRQELPVRIAHRIRDLQNLPFVVGLNPNLERVYISYLDSFERIRKFPTINSLSDNEQFCDVLKNLLKDHWGTIPRMMIGLLESSIHLPAAARERFMTVSLVYCRALSCALKLTCPSAHLAYAPFADSKTSPSRTAYSLNNAIS